MTAPSYASIDPELQDHLDALGFHFVGSYRIWCHKQGLDKRLAKTDEQLVDEAALFLRLQAKAQPSPKKGHCPGTVRTLTKIYNGARGGWTHPEAMFDAAADQAERDALLRILVHLETYTGISWWVGARLAKHHAEWLRPVEEWYPHGENVELQVGALANHLLARYDAPLFMGRAWLDGATARRCQSWFLHIARGGNIRSMDTEIHLTRRMAHAFPRAPDNLTIPMALRWAQCVGMGASRDLAHAIVRLAASIPQGRRERALLGYRRSPPSGPSHARPDARRSHYRNQRFVPVETVGPDGQISQGAPPQPSLVMKGRSIDKLLRQVEA
jgi:hypothetical protein